MIHYLKTVPKMFQEVWDDHKLFEIRENES